MNTEDCAGVRVKICGITRPDDALRAEALGVSAVGFVFFPGSPRYIKPERAGAISEMLGPFIARVGVFVDVAPEELHETVKTARLTAVQLHGDESPGCVEALIKNGVRCIKAFRVGPDFESERLADYGDGTFLLDTLAEGGCRGGTGKTFDWTVAAACRRYGRIILAGGLNAGNVREAIETVRPWGVDVSSGIEASPGVKDHEAMKQFVNTVRS